ncbi:RNA 2',3'-cyclic phosphodiesterase [Chelativorans sp. ZYF759]|uniref:RNA 2',3'-cyclic phosphodiesterase n=1 Tax=Chelativorans sp. ZYF759 TaxID=2692213 RepID=UPI00145CD3B5|nr:RNA 2',3'-cyclic phosphodiesterase [Chelativorans sp. ZYF759]NMG38224.1 RNA 2',3'-cyclic phosphodiesterase [Chelativorans sp. ZYF759]
MPRLFTALEVPRDAAMSLSLLRGGLPGARWVDGENYHITLRFFGDVEGHVADEIANALDRVRRPAFTISLSGVGAFGGKKPHALWAGVSASPDLFTLQSEIERKCQRLGLPADPRKFVPHVTLARLRNVGPHEVAAYLSSRGNFSTAPFRVSRFVLMSAREVTGGGPYVVEEAWPLQGANIASNFDMAGAEASRSFR